MTKWEYQHFTGMVGRREDYVEDPQVTLSRLGAEGWELLAVHPVPQLGHMYATAFLYVLKREASRPPAPPMPPRRYDKVDIG